MYFRGIFRGFRVVLGLLAGCGEEVESDAIRTLKKLGPISTFYGKKHCELFLHHKAHKIVAQNGLGVV